MKPKRVDRHHEKGYLAILIGYDHIYNDQSAKLTLLVNVSIDDLLFARLSNDPFK
jgi:hypothetical protein